MKGLISKNEMILAKRKFIDEYLLIPKLTKDKCDYWRKIGYKDTTVFKLIGECNGQYKSEIEKALTGYYTKETILNSYHNIITRNEGGNDKLVQTTLDSIAKITGMIKDSTDVNITIPKLQVEYLTAPILPTPTFFDSGSNAI